VGVEVEVQLSILGILRAGLGGDVGEDLSGMRLAVFVAAFTSHAIGDLGDGGEVALIGGIGVGGGGDGDVLGGAVLAEGQIPE